MTAPVPARLGDNEPLTWDHVCAMRDELSRLRAAETRVRELAKGHAITAHAIGHTDYERKFLDILHVLGDQP